jgi:hypothetical protein
MELVVADRRLLKAFYTQYTAVLLIVLTFTIGAFQRTLGEPQRVTDVLTWAPRAVIGSITVEDLFAYDGSLKGDSPSLAAVVSLLNTHDLVARVTYLSSEGSARGDGSSIKRTVRRLDVLRTFFLQHGVIPSAVLLQARSSGEGTERVTVEIMGES